MNNFGHFQWKTCFHNWGAIDYYSLNIIVLTFMLPRVLKNLLKKFSCNFWLKHKKAVTFDGFYLMICFLRKKIFQKKKENLKRKLDWNVLFIKKLYQKKEKNVSEDFFLSFWSSFKSFWGFLSQDKKIQILFYIRKNYFQLKIHFTNWILNIWKYWLYYLVCT